MANTDAMGFWKIAEADPGHIAVIDPEHRVMTYGDLYALSNQLVHGLRALGLKRGDQVTTVLPNSFEQVAFALAAFQGGFYYTPVNWHLVGPEIAYIVNDSETKAFIVSERFAGEAVRVLAESNVAAPNRFSIGAVDGFRPLAELITGQSKLRPDELATCAYMFYTSGTTGRPKGVRRALPAVDPDTMGSNSGGLFLLFNCRPHDGNVHITQAPLYHTAVNNWTTTSLQIGHSVVLMDRWTAEGALERYERYHVTQSHMVPTMFNRMLQLPDEVRLKYDVSSLRSMVHAAAPCPVETKKRMIEWWGDAIWEYYAATEGGGTWVSAKEWMQHPGTVGKPWPNSEVIVVDEQGEQLPPYESGTIYMRMGGNQFEYYKDADKTSKSRLKDSGFWTVGDVGYFDADGFLFLNDRSNDMIIVGGVNVYPAEIEGALIQHPAVADVAVFGIPNEDTGEEIKAVVELRAGSEPTDATTKSIMDYCRDNLARQKHPRTIDYTTEMPRDPNGKLYKRKLREPYWVGRTRNI
ncbi:MAG: acyl-CoA synthetase [Actinobacteria bacterium]|nr:MAG: acyl-CoA synthetase [Actinomycetota bacterium]